jgi:hypothetical protein
MTPLTAMPDELSNLQVPEAKLNRRLSTRGVRSV